MLSVDSRIETVTLYHQGATVRRRVEVECPGGVPPREIEIGQLPLSLRDASVRVRVEAESTAGTDAEVVAAQVRVGLSLARENAAFAPPDLHALRTLLRAIQRSDEALDQLETELQMLRSVPVPPRPEAAPGRRQPASPMAPRLGLQTILDDALDARLREARALRAERETLEEQAAEIRARIAAASTAREVKPHELRKAAVVQLRHTGARIPRVVLALEYFVGAARWAPAYQCRMSRDCRQAEIVMRALICQLTGEDWRGVRLVLSTAAPLQWTELPELSSVRIGRAQAAPPSRAAVRPPPAGASALFGDFDRDRAQAAAQLPAAPAYALPELARPAALALHREVVVGAEPPRPKGTMREVSLDDGYGRGGGAAAESEDFMAAGGGGSLTFGGAAGPSPAPPVHARAAAAAAPRMSRAVSPPRPAPGPSAMPSPAAPPPPPRAPAPPRELMLYSHLRLPAAEETRQRSKLQAQDTQRAYVESIARFNLVLNLDVVAVVREAEAAASRVQAVPLPSGAADVRRARGHAFDFAYHADVAVDAPSDGVFHSVALGSRTAEADVLYVVVPREDTQVYRQALLRNPLAAPMLSGPAEVYVGGDYVLSTTLPTVPPRGECKLGLGVEQAIKCARNTQFREQRSGSKVVATSELWHDVTIELVNNLDREVRCEVRERIPQPAVDAEVVVEEGRVEPPWESYTQAERKMPVDGGRRWTLAIAPGSTARLAAQYVVKLYANNELAGGNRREA